MLDTDHLTRRFGDLVAADDVTISVPAGRLTGFVGSNGAGKTTTMRMITGVLAPHGGDVHWDGRPITAAHRRRFGYMPEERGLYPKQRVLDQLVYLGRLTGRREVAVRAAALELLDRLGLADRAKERVEKLSLGNQQRVQIVAALVCDPVALVLDEPFSGLDPQAVDDTAGLLREYVAAGLPVLFSSHQLDLVDRLCDRLVVMARGRVVAQGTADELRAGLPRRIRLVTADDAGWVRGLRGVHVVDVDGPAALIEVLDPGAEQDVLRAATARGDVRSFGAVVPPLSEIYREAVA